MQEPLDRDAFVWAVGSLCALHRVPFAADLLLRRFPPPYDVASLQQALIAYEFKTAQQALVVKDIHPSVFPVLAILKPTVEENEISEKTKTSEALSTKLTEQQTEAAAQENPAQQEKIAALAETLQPLEQEQAEQVVPNHNLAIILKIDQDRVLLLNPGDQTPNTISVDEYNALATGQIILATRQIEEVSADGLVGESPVETKKKEKQPFGFKWFIPAIPKHNAKKHKQEGKI